VRSGRDIALRVHDTNTVCICGSPQGDRARARGVLEDALTDAKEAARLAETHYPVVVDPVDGVGRQGRIWAGWKGRWGHGRFSKMVYLYSLSRVKDTHTGYLQAKTKPIRICGTLRKRS